MIAMGGKTLRGSKTSPEGALYIVLACATEAGLVLAQRAADGGSNEITAIHRDAMGSLTRNRKCNLFHVTVI